MPRLSCGYEFVTAPRLDEALNSATEARFDFVVLPLTHPRNERDSNGVSDARESPLTRSDLLMNSTQWSNIVVGRVSRWIDLDSSSEQVRLNSEKTLRQEIAWATYISLSAIVLPFPMTSEVYNYAHIVNNLVRQATFLHCWLEVPLVAQEAVEEGEEYVDTWKIWNQFSTLCEYQSNLHVALRVGETLPSGDELLKWKGEPVRTIFLPTNVFSFNAKGYPTLGPDHKEFVALMHRQKAQFVVTGNPKGHGNLIEYQMYLEHLISRLPELSEMESYEEPYLDFLQAPLQPLMDNLESQTYETFEKDPIKYRQYQEAVRRALVDRKDSGPIVLMVVGAGRGPLVKASLRASRDAGCPITVYAVEKNPNAVVTLRNLKLSCSDWDCVTIVHQDMRKWEAAEKADILVSELLGSWGDNELSPECLDGAQRFLKEDGISIPYEYTSFVSPVSTHKLWNGVSDLGELKHLETPYVVKLHNFYEIDQAKALFKFVHPNKDEEINNARYAQLEFECKTDTVMHGFAGYFEAMLYKDVDISINPSTFSDGMFSWFPCYIPIRTPIRLKKGDRVKCQFWRKIASAKVWYEWSVSEPSCGPIHNPNGRSYSMVLYTT